MAALQTFFDMRFNYLALTPALAFIGVTNAHGPPLPAKSKQVPNMESCDLTNKSLVITISYQKDFLLLYIQYLEKYTS